MENEKLYKIYYGNNKEEYITRYLKDSDIINGYLSEAKAFDLFYDDMIMCNSYFENDDWCEIESLLSGYIEEEDCYVDEYQLFIIDFDFNEDVIIKATEKMGNTLYYDNEKGLYITGITDLGTSRTIVPTQIKVKELKGSDN